MAFKISESSDPIKVEIDVQTRQVMENAQKEMNRFKTILARLAETPENQIGPSLTVDQKPQNFVVRENSDFVSVIFRGMPKKAAAADMKLVKGQPNVVSGPGPESYQHTPSTPQEEIARTDYLLQFFKPEPPEDTVGDLSIVTAEKRKRDQAEDNVSVDELTTVGDLSIVTAEKRKREREALN